VWVTRSDYKSVGDIQAIMHDCESLGLNAVIFQVRGNGTAFYKSSIEPWADELSGGDPGFDPLAVAVEEAHSRGMNLHAWVNVMPGWRGTEPPRNPQQLYNARPEWFWYDQKGRRQPLTSTGRDGKRKTQYVSLNPCLPEVRAYLVSVFAEIARNYEIDGLHLDYIRFPNEYAPRGVDYPYDARTLALFRRDTGKTPAQSPKLWNQWRTDQVTAVVRETRDMLRKTRPNAKLSASVIPDPERARADHFQDGAMWAWKGWVDFLIPMNYTADEALFIRRADAWRQRSAGKPIVMGLGVYAHASHEGLARQIELADRWGQGFCLFAYSSLFNAADRNRAGTTRPDWSAGRREARLAAIRPLLLRMANNRS